MEIYLIRHTAVEVPSGVCYGQSDVPLKESFYTEAEVVREKLAQVKNTFYPYSDFDHVFCSPLSRCVKLADYCGYKEAIKDDRIKEISFGEWELQRFDEIGDPVLQEWYKDYLHVRATGGESFEDQYARVAAFLSGLKEKESGDSPKKIAIFAHGGVLICARIFAGEISPGEAFNSLTPFGGIIKITF